MTTTTVQLTAVSLATVLAATALTFAMPAAADEHTGAGDVRVVNKSTAMVVNNTEAGAYTGANHAGGSYAGAGARGGDVRNAGDEQDVDTGSTGRGGDGGNSSQGGTVESGNAVATAVTTNRVNHNDTRVNRCACDGDDEGKTTVRNESFGFLANGTAARAKTGYNSADGSVGGGAGRGGDIGNTDGEQDLADVRTGRGGNGGRSGFGGYVKSGSANSLADTLNVVNRNVTRVNR